MSLPIVLATDFFGLAPKSIEKESKFVQATWLCIPLLLFVLDIVTVLSSLLIGILGLTTASALTTSTLTCWSLIGLGSAVILVWIVVPLVKSWKGDTHKTIHLGSNLKLKVKIT